MLTSHVERLAQSANLMLQDGGMPQEPVFSAPQLRQPVLQALAAAVHQLRQQQQQQAQASASNAPSNGSRGTDGDSACIQPAPGEVKLTVLLTWQDSGARYDLWCHAQPLPGRPVPPISVQIRQAPPPFGRAGLRPHPDTLTHPSPARTIRTRSLRVLRDARNRTRACAL